MTQLIPPNGFIFLCNNRTQKECLDRMLFGTRRSNEEAVKQIKKGDIGFLYNYDTARLHGVFEAVSDGSLEIERGAWGGLYPAQVTVAWKTRYETTIHGGILKGLSFIRFKGRYITNITLTPLQAQEIELLFKTLQDVKPKPPAEDVFRKKFPAEFRADDGHTVRTKGEMLIDNWLYRQKIVHAYERKVPISEAMYCDFFIPLGEGFLHRILGKRRRGIP